MVSILNGLSAMGASVAQFAGNAGLELQKQQLAEKSALLADQLATTRETALEGQRQTFQTGLEGQRQTFQGSQTDKEIAARTAQNAATIAAENARSAAQRQTQVDLETMRQNAPTETEKLFKFLGVNPDGTLKAGASTPDTGAAPPTPKPETAPTDNPQAPVPVAGGLGLVRYADGSVGTPSNKATDATAGGSGSASDTSGTTPSAAPKPATNPLDNPIVRKALGQPAIGSDEDVRRTMLMGVKNDPAYNKLPPELQYAEFEKRMAVAKGTMTSPDTQLANARMIASYQIKEPDGFALSRPGAAETMALVYKLNPDYQASRFTQVSDAMKRFGAEKEGDQVRYLDVGVQHMQVFDEAVKALASGDMPRLNALSNWFKTNMGISAPTTLGGIKQIVLGEIQRAATGGIGSDADREALRKSLDEARSPQQLQDMTNGFRALLTGQLKGLKRQYESSTGFKDGPFAFDTKLSPESLRVLTPDAAASAPVPPPAGFRIVQ